MRQAIIEYPEGYPQMLVAAAVELPSPRTDRRV